MAGRLTVAVTNTSPIIGLVTVGQLHVIEQLVGLLIVPFEVLGELHGLDSAPEPLAVMALSNVRFWPLIASPPAEALGLHEGERAAIGIALATPGASVLLDEKEARGVARSLRLHVVGTLGILVQAKRAGLVDAIEPLITQLVDSGFRLGSQLIDGVLKSVGER